MTSSGSRLLVLVFPALLAAAPAFAGDAPRLETRTRARIAEMWGVDPAAIRIEWSDATDPGALPGDGIPRIVGAGRNGWFALVVDSDSGGHRALRIRAGVLDTIHVASVPLAIGDRLGPTDTRLETQVRWGGPDRRSLSRAEPGWRVRRPIAAGEAICWPAVAPPPLVEAGESIALEWTKGAVRISAEGTAIHAAGLGDRIQVRLNGRRGLLEATVTAPGIARLRTGGER